MRRSCGPGACTGTRLGQLVRVWPDELLLFGAAASRTDASDTVMGTEHNELVMVQASVHQLLARTSLLPPFVVYPVVIARSRTVAGWRSRSGRSYRTPPSSGLLRLVRMLVHIRGFFGLFVCLS